MKCVQRREKRRVEVFVEVRGSRRRWGERGAQRHEKMERIGRRWKEQERESSYTAGESECSLPSETVD